MKRLSVGLACAVLLSACASAPQSGEPQVPLTSQFATLVGADTIGVELVTRCAGRIIGNLESPSPKAHITYDAYLAEDGVPRELLVAIWTANDPASSPGQRIRHFWIADTAITHVWKGTAQQIQRSWGQAGSFPWLSGYAGLSTQLLEVLAKRGVKAPPLRLLYLGTGGKTVSAHLQRATRDSVIAVVDTQTVFAEWDRVHGLTRATIPSRRVQIVRTSIGGVPAADALCSKGPFMKFDTDSGTSIKPLNKM
jgi:hypothetical protein